MKAVSDFRRIDADGPTVTVTFDGSPLRMRAGESVAAGLLAAGVLAFRATPVSGAPRGPFCMMGACFDCLIEIDGETVQACMTLAREGLTIRRVPGRVCDDG